MVGPAADAATGDPVPLRRTPAPVDLDLPFTLDQPTPAPAPTRADATTAQPATTADPADAADPNGAAGPNGPANPNGVAGPIGAGGSNDAIRPDGTADVGSPDGAADAVNPLAAADADGVAGTPPTAAPAEAASSADGMSTAAVTPVDGPAGTPPNGRPESPWAQPPQRSTADALAPPAHPGPAVRSTENGATTPADPPRRGATTPAASGHPVENSTPAASPHQAGPPQPAAGATDPAPVASAGVPHSAPESPAGGSPDAAPPRLGPFPPSPGVPLQQPYGDGTGYPPGPVGYGQPAPQPGAPGWYPPPWPQQAGGPPQQAAAPPQSPPPPHQAAPHQPSPHQAGPQQTGPHQTGPHQTGPHQLAPQQNGPQQPGPAAYPKPVWTPASGAPPTAEDFARRRQARPVDPVATMGVRAVVNKIGLVRLAPGRQEQEMRRDIEMVRRNFGGLRQVTVVNPKGGAGKTVAILLLAMTFGQKRGGYVLAWDNNETQGTLGMRAQQDFHSRTVRDMLRDLAQFQGPHGRVGDLSQYVRSQGEGMFDVLASDESATGGEMLTAAAFAEIREVVSRFYKLIFVDTGNNVRAQNWQAAMDATDQLVVTMSARNDSAETAARMLDHLEQSGRQRLVRQAVTVVSMPPSRKEIDLPAIQEHFAARTRAVLLAPYERLIDTGEPIRYGQLSTATREAWLKIAASVAEGL
nr:chromosome partitioning protein [Micromonospora terminaliae]